MKKRTITLYFFCLILSSSVLISSAVLNVCPVCNYTAIQSAINNASSGDVINVSAGVYAESVNVNKGVEVIGNGAILNPASGNSAEKEAGFFVE